MLPVPIEDRTVPERSEWGTVVSLKIPMTTKIPLAYFITFRCYGTWLHGDSRSSVDRFNRRFKEAFCPPNKQTILAKCECISS